MTNAASSLGEPSDKELVEACLSDNNTAWETLIRRYERLIYSVPIRFGMTAQEAVDVFQSVCFILFRKLRSLRNHERIYSWLITTTTRECWRLGAQNNPKYGRETSWMRPADFGVSAEQLAIERRLIEEQSVALRAAMAELPPKCRELLTVLYLVSDEPTYEGVAKRLNMPVSSIGPTRGRCLHKLRRILEEKFESPALRAGENQPGCPGKYILTTRSEKQKDT
jgi:RNA polymerase sigma factor (sigma-70 family)